MPPQCQRGAPNRFFFVIKEKEYYIIELKCKNG